MTMAVIVRTGIGLAVFLLLQACSGNPTLSRAESLEGRPLIAEIWSGEAVLGRELQAGELPHYDILHVTDEMRDFVDRYVRQHRTKTGRAAKLLRAVLTPGLLGIVYSEEQTHTAEQAFRSQQANCLGFSNLFIALAREAGLKAYYQDVLVAPDWDLNEGSMTLRRHVNVLIKVSRRLDQVVDISRTRQNIVRLDATQLTDNQAFAQYYNNRSVDYLYQQDYQRAYLYARKALDLDARSAFIWSNIGVILSRVDQLEHAEAALLHAVKLNSAEQAALVNLTSIYRARGDVDKMAYYEKQVRRYRARNPYYLLLSARKAYNEAEYPEAMSLLRKAVSIKRDEALLFELKARTHLRLGEQGKAIKALQKAIDVAETVAQRSEYSELLSELQADKIPSIPESSDSA